MKIHSFVFLFGFIVWNRSKLYIPGNCFCRMLQVENWTPDLIQIESEAKQDALILMFVVTRETRAVASMIEIAEHMSAGRNVVLVLQDVDPNIRIGGHVRGVKRMIDILV